jgi:hypothetical protein
MKRLSSILILLTIVSTLLLSCSSINSVTNDPQLDIPEEDLAILDSLKENISRLNLDFDPGSFIKKGRLSQRWSKISSSIVSDYIVSIDEGWIMCTYDDVDLENSEITDLSYVIDPMNGKRNSSFLTKYYGLSTINNRKYIETFSEHYCVIYLKRPYIINRHTGSVVGAFSRGDVLNVDVMLTKDYAYCYHPPLLERINLHESQRVSLMPGFYENVYNIDNSIWLYFGIMRLLDEKTNTIIQDLYCEDYLDLGLIEDFKSIPIVQFARNVKYHDYIIGRVVIYNQLVDVCNGKDVPYSFYLPYLDTFPLENNLDVIKYVLFNPNEPESSVTIDTDSLGTMDSIIRIKNNHFIVENDSVLKCIDPFEGNDIWWIDREDVGQEAKILWADERGVLVYSYTHQKLYCFE